MVVESLIIFSPSYFSIFFYFFVVQPRMRDTCKDSKFLYSLPHQALIYISAVLLFFSP